MNKRLQSCLCGVLKWASAIVVLGILLWFGFAHLHMRAMQRARVYHDRVMLTKAYDALTNNKPAEIVPSRFQIYRYTNVITINGTTQQCILALNDPWFRGEGILAVSTNRICVWLSRNANPRVVDETYKAPLLVRRF